MSLTKSEREWSRGKFVAGGTVLVMSVCYQAIDPFLCVRNIKSLLEDNERC